MGKTDKFWAQGNSFFLSPCPRLSTDISLEKELQLQLVSKNKVRMAREEDEGKTNLFSDADLDVSFCDGSRSWSSHTGNIVAKCALCWKWPTIGRESSDSASEICALLSTPWPSQQNTLPSSSYSLQYVQVRPRTDNYAPNSV